MNNLQKTTEEYLEFCRYQKGLDAKTIKAYKIDLNQMLNNISVNGFSDISMGILEEYIAFLQKNYKPKTTKRKIASLKAFFSYLEYKNIIYLNPFSKMHLRIKEPLALPKTIPVHNIEILLSTMYKQLNSTEKALKKRHILRDITVIELLFATGMRISELCSLKPECVNLYEHDILIQGKGAKERKIQICDPSVIAILNKYKNEYEQEIKEAHYFFINNSGCRLSDQSVREMIKKYCKLAHIEQHITPHMFRHSFATLLLEADVDIRYIQQMLGHSSINITEIYTHVAMSKQKNILETKHPRKALQIESASHVI